jgi:hypothetical protein
MKITVQVVIEPADGPAIVAQVATLERETLTDETLGLSLAEGKAILAGVQERLVAQQAAAYVATQQTCPQCGARRRCKRHHQIVIRSLFGTLRLDSPRLSTCACQGRDTPRSTSPLAEQLPERTTPERREEGGEVGGTPAVWRDRRRTGGGAAAAGESGDGLPACAAGGRTAGGRVGRRATVLDRGVSARLGCPAATRRPAHRRYRWRLRPRP